MASFVSVLALAACGSSTTVAENSPSPSPSPPPTQVVCSTSGPASPDWPGANEPGQIVSAAAAGNTLKITFAKGTPSWDVTPVATAQFTTDPKGETVTLQGSVGVLIHLRGFQTVAQGNLNTISSSGPGSELLEVRKLGDFEGVVTIGAGLSLAGCAVVTSTATSLTFTFVGHA